MTPRRRPRRISARLLVGLLPLAVTLAVLSGCDDTYDESILYPPRTDWLVEKTIKAQPTRYDPPGRFPLSTLDGDKELFGKDDQDLLINERKDQQSIHDPRGIGQQDFIDLTRSLRDLAGRPRLPKIDLNDLRFEEVNRGLERDLKLDRKTLAAGSALFRKHCLHCHGLAGDGRGPTGPWVNPHPRDFRQGLFKFTSTDPNVGKPRREDIRRVLVNGIDGTSMPSFHLLAADDLDALVSYVIHLAIRGEAEYATLIDLVKETEEKAKKAGSAAAETGTPVINRVREAAAAAAERWLGAQKAEVQPDAALAEKFARQTQDERLASAARGYTIFTTKELSACGGCHVNLGRDAQFMYDSWGTIVRPRNLTLPHNIRGGKRPIDLYWRIRIGINGAGMPAFDLAEKTPAQVTLQNELAKTKPFMKDLGSKEEWIWDLVNFVEMVPYPQIRRDLREKYQIEID